MLFRKKLTEQEAAAAFVKSILKLSDEVWPGFVQSMERVFGDDTSRIQNDAWASLEFGLAALAVQSAALPNLVPPEQAARIESYIEGFLQTPDLEDRALRGFRDYREAWTSAITASEMPFSAVASVLYDRLDLHSTVESAGQTFKSPTLLIVLSDAVTRCGGGWWKNVLKDYKVVS